MKWPDHADREEPRLTPSGAWAISEVYWLYGLIKIAPASIIIGAYWATADKATPTSEADHLFIVLFLIPALFGLYDFFRFRRYFFYPDEKKLIIEGFNLSLGRFQKSYTYAQVRTDLVARWVFSGQFEKRYFAMFYFPGIQVAFMSSLKEEQTRALLERLRNQLGLDRDERHRRCATGIRHPPRSSASRADPHGVQECLDDV